MRRILIFAACLLSAGLLPAADGDGVSAVLTVAPGEARVILPSTPRAVPLAELGLREAGLAAAPTIFRADEVRIFADASRTNESPAARIWVHSGQTNRYWFHTGGSGSAEGFTVPKGAAVAVVLKASTNALAWRNPLDAK